MQIKTDLTLFNSERNQSTTITIYHQPIDGYATEFYIYESIKKDCQVKNKSSLITLTSREFADFLEALKNKEEICFRNSYDDVFVATGYHLQESLQDKDTIYHEETITIVINGAAYSIFGNDVNEFSKFAGDLLACTEEGVLL